MSQVTRVVDEDASESQWVIIKLSIEVGDISTTADRCVRQLVDQWEKDIAKRNVA